MFGKIKFQLFAQMTLGCVFLLSGILKVLSPFSAIQLLEKFLMIGQRYSHAVIFALSLFEIVIGVMFMIGKATFFASILSAAFFLGATFVGVFLLSDPVPCGCFGNFLESKTDEVFLIRSLTFFLLSFFVLRNSTETKS